MIPFMKFVTVQVEKWNHWSFLSEWDIKLRTDVEGAGPEQIVVDVAAGVATKTLLNRFHCCGIYSLGTFPKNWNNLKEKIV